MKRWTRLRCTCGASWRCWGNPAEARVLQGIFERAHAGRGHVVRAVSD